MSLQVFKFGGASVKNQEGFKNVCDIIKKYKQDQLVVVVSATGKTTNQLEEVVKNKFSKDIDAKMLLKAIQDKHVHIVQELGFGEEHPIYQEIHEHFVEAEWVVEEQRESPYDYTYDQIVSVGELVSSRILHNLLMQMGVDVVWADARGLIRTDETYREGRIQWDVTNYQVEKELAAYLSQNKVIVTQGFIGSTGENNTCTLGREGSDYTAAIISSALNTDAMTIWKDVPGILTADPSVFENVSKLDRLSYTEAIEMTYYGAKVIHPKTIQPLKLKNIPLYVKSFIHPAGEGSVIAGEFDVEYPPIVVLESNQVLLHFSSRDLSFIAEHHLARLFDLFEKYRIKVNMMRNTAISFSICTGDDSKKIEAMLAELHGEYTVFMDRNLELITVRHYIESMLPKLLEGKIVVMEERITKTIQLVVKEAPAIVYKVKKDNE